MEELVGINIGKDPIEVKHSDLERSDDSLYRSNCPSCKEGMLLVRRDMNTVKLEANDWCTLCGQHFIYTDIEELKERDWA